MSEILLPPPAGKNHSWRLYSSDPLAALKVKLAVKEMLSAVYKPYIHQLVVLCIGTDRSTGDALGPLTGSKLARLAPEKTVVFGTLDEPVHAMNLQETLEKIQSYYNFPLVIAVDACLGRPDSVGAIDLGLGSLQPGAGVHKDLPQVGDMYINGIVNVGGFLEYLVLQNTRLSLVVKMSEIIARGLYFALREANSVSPREKALSPGHTSL